MTEAVSANVKNIESDLTWMDMLKGLAIIGVFFDNWTAYYDLNFPLWGPFVQVFFILSGFGLSVAYLKSRQAWNWKRWTWRRFTKIVVPYEIAVLFSFMLGLIGAQLYTTVYMQFSWTSLFTYVTFTRNFYPPSYGWNPPFWFMPVIIGLYISFPILITIMNKWGLKVLLLVSFLITYGSITVSIIAGLHGDHARDLFSFWMIQFALGISLAYIRDSQPQQLNKLLGLGAFTLGMSLFAFSWVLRTYVPYGKAYNDLITSLGIFLILLNIGWLSRWLIPPIGDILNHLGRKSYLMYLIHYPIIVFLIGLLLRPLITNFIIGMALGTIYILVIFLICHFISSPMDKLTSWMYFLLFPPYSKELVASTT